MLRILFLPQGKVHENEQKEISSSAHREVANAALSIGIYIAICRSLKLLHHFPSPIRKARYLARSNLAWGLAYKLYLVKSSKLLLSTESIGNGSFNEGAWFDLWRGSCPEHAQNSLGVW